MTKNMLPRICQKCGTRFLGGPRAWFCPACRNERRLESHKRMREKKKTLDYIPLGSVIQCQICGIDIIKTGGRKYYCDDCAAMHLKKVDNQQSIEWKVKNPEKIKESKRKERKKRHLEESKKSGIKYITWDKWTLKWRVRPYVNNKQISVGRYSDLVVSKEKLDNFMDNIKNTTSGYNTGG